MPLHQLMIRFENPEYVLLLIPVLAIYLFLFIHAERNYRRLMRVLSIVKKRKKLRYLILLLKIPLIVLLILSICTPYVESIEKKPIEYGDIESLRKVPVSLVFLVDVSKSMNYGNRIGDVRTLLSNLIPKMSYKDHLVVALFARDTEVVYEGPPSNFTVKLKAGKKYSAIGDALSFALSYTRASSLPTAVVLITDGGWNYGSDPLHIAPLFKNIPLAVVHVGYGTSSNPDLLREISEKASGKYYEVNQITLEAVESLTEHLYSEIKYSALRLRGENYVQCITKDYTTPQMLLWSLICILLVLTVMDGV